jgi:hypothetical protein
MIGRAAWFVVVAFSIASIPKIVLAAPSEDVKTYEDLLKKSDNDSCILIDRIIHSSFTLKPNYALWTAIVSQNFCAINSALSLASKDNYLSAFGDAVLRERKIFDNPQMSDRGIYGHLNDSIDAMKKLVDANMVYPQNLVVDRNHMDGIIMSAVAGSVAIQCRHINDPLSLLRHLDELGVNHDVKMSGFGRSPTAKDVLAQNCPELVGTLGW